ESYSGEKDADAEKTVLVCAIVFALIGRWGLRPFFGKGIASLGVAFPILVIGVLMGLEFGLVLFASLFATIFVAGESRRDDDAVSNDGSGCLSGGGGGVSFGGGSGGGFSGGGGGRFGGGGSSGSW
ncbi:MAG TPA: hypothetical protein VFM46_01870, partial [Pseudomonadales bacterium]|nr:hypothetical protein [Pseudomonadales bacterium]